MRLGMVAMTALAFVAIGGGSPAAATPLPGVPHFLSTCTLSHRAPDDPIVHPGMPGMSHMHDFFGNVSTDAMSTLRSLRRAPTTCHPNGDRSGYWTPTLYAGTRPAALSAVTIYYEAPGADPDAVRPFPRGLKMLAGFPMARRPSLRGDALWSCTGEPETAGRVTIPVCPPWAHVRLVVRFPDCWDGRHLDSPGHRRHMAYSQAGLCPLRAPVLVPRVRFDIEYATSGWPGAVIASGWGYTAHADFFNAWRPSTLARRIDTCIHGRLRCNYNGQSY